jgi:hypothetical protein
VVNKICATRGAFAATVVIATAAILYSTADAAAAIPDNPCATPLPAAAAANGLLQVTSHAVQPQPDWQRRGRDIDLSIRSSELPNSGVAKAFVCFRWQVARDPGDTAKPDGFIPAASTGTVIPLATLAGPLKFTATVPTSLPQPLSSPRSPNAVKPYGVYAKNNAFPIADVRVLVYGAEDKLLFDLISSIGVVGTDEYCNMPLGDTTVDSGVGELGKHKNWQPFGGEFEFTVKTSKVIPTNALVKVCFRWKLSAGYDPGAFHESGPTHMTDKQPQSIKVAATVVNIADSPGSPKYSYAIPFFSLVPLVDTRVLIVDTDGSPVADVLTTVGITNLYIAAVVVVLAIAVAFLILWLCGKYRLSTLPKCGPILRVITTRAGYASLSQFQIILWTFVVIASAAYVMALSGDLIEITTGTLVLLGISGTTTVISKAKSESDTKATPRQPDPAEAAAEAETAKKEATKLRLDAKLTSGSGKDDANATAEEAEAYAAAAKARSIAADAVATAQQKRAAVATAADAEKAKAETDANKAEADAQRALKNAAIAGAKAETATRKRHPAWSDLVMEEIEGREIDVTRVQMLYFTLVTAAFVLMKVLTSYEIPVIPEGFLILMGISNSVYVGSKFAGGSKQA